MKKLNLLLFLIAFVIFNMQSQENTYQPERTKYNTLVHTKLKVSFDFAKREMPAEAWVTLKPHFYPTNKVTLDAKVMQIDAVLSNTGKKLEYEYDGKQLKITLNNTYTKNETYTVHIKYIAKPEELKSEGSAAITDEKGLYFIDHDGTNPDIPTQIWTQGETESSSVWFPTIDSPNQKTTQEIYMTVASKYVTLSNGTLVSQTENANGTRTDYWKMDQKHAPYLFFMGVGEFSIIHDFYKGKSVDYYVDKEYEPYAREIFGNTPEMMQFFSDKLGVEYPWPKYAQIVAHEYVSGAMENTTATLHGESAYQTSGQLIDENTWEDVIAHELFHHWFGDLVTTESWSNLTVNESFANYSEYLWREYKYGKDHADAHRNTDLNGYYSGKNEEKNLVRFHYANDMDMFDAVSYNKGGGILHMLRNYLGDGAFFAGLKEYLEVNKFGTAEAHQLRLSLEKISGRDLNQFFNQWYFGSGHPNLNIEYDYDETNKKATITVKQTGKLFRFPVKINVYENNQPKTYEIWIDKAEESFGFLVDSKPKLIDFDIEKTLVAKITDNKSTENYIFQYTNAPSYENRREAIEKLATQKEDKNAVALLKLAIKDSYFGLRKLALENVDLTNDNFNKFESLIKKTISNDPKTLVQAAAINTLSKIATIKDISIFENAMQSKSYSVKRNALNAIYKLDKSKALNLAKQITSKFDKKSMKDALINIYINENDESQYPFIAKHIITGMFMSRSAEGQQLYGKALQQIMKSDNVEATQVFVNDAVKMGNQFKQYGADKMLLQVLNQFLTAKKDSESDNKTELISIVQKGIDGLK